MITRIDRYIMGKFLGTFFFILAILMAIAIVFDFAEKVDDFIEFKVSFWDLLTKYYINFVFHYSNLFSSLIIFISVIFFTSKMAKNNELIAVLCSGMSFNRMLRPFFLAATVLVVLSIFLNHLVLPRANKIRLDFEESIARHSVLLNNVHLEVEPGVIVYFDNNHYGYLDAFCMEKWEEGSLKSVLTAQRAYYDTLNTKWSLQFYHIRYVSEYKDSIVRGDKRDTTFNFAPSDLGYRNEFSSSMTTPELLRFIETEKRRGSTKVQLSQIELHQRTSYPAAAYILTLIGVCVAGRKSRGGIGLNIAIGLVLAVTYIFSMRLTSVAATNAGLDASIAVWIPNFMFLLLTFPLYRFAQK
ncbi:MAG TPA: permease [Flavobacteriales bacterium]|nr:permease [Flavobacteriales bacterium]HRE74780.1 LptF/LptG family permease [Flavobacteriales bacterium]HRJ35791.1 LptF/LptG family permease [Flavobacteriales bacterium]HRJ38389.1 LptF/LptG family permease [Flavobacteriales bacterium]